ncbi:DnaD domain-containing protein [Jeotgalibacillus terrae]|uniref:DnaD domain-containing protein n=1 Tax=Jeotgalibacillus terrae TaxID=587735 RepID=A0ABW5ZGU7_9BACL|nr:DnaD domain protein [Jeotgalibacillus terrae]MBM7577695.1 DnaD/phage-associated family protein [Jeotgalibacillus terrae]
MSKLLIYEAPLQVLPTLAVKLGLNEAIFTQQLHYWLQHSNNERDGHKWVYKKIDQWHKEFPFWSASTVKRVIKNLENKGVLITADHYNKIKIDKTKWYRIDYQKLNDLTRDQNDPSTGQNDLSTGQIDTHNNHKITSLDFNNNNEQAEPEKENPENQKPKHEDQNPIRFYEQNIGPASPYLMTDILNWIDDLSPQLVIEAIKKALEANKRSWGYIKSILLEWSVRNVRTIEDVQALDVEFKNSRSNNGAKTHQTKRPGEEDLNLDD